MNHVAAKILIVLFLIIEVSCGGDIPDCPSNLCVLAGGWKLVEVYIDGVKDTSTDLSKYQLTLLMPSPTTAVTSLFNRVNPSGRADQGTWKLQNNDKLLVLTPASSPDEPYIIKYFTPRQLNLVIDREVGKIPQEFEFVLEPF